MTVVTGIMLILGRRDWEGDPLCEVQTWLAERCDGQQLRDVTEFAGGSRHPQFEAWCAGINFLVEDEFTGFVMSRRWRDPENFVLILQPEEGPSRVNVQRHPCEG